MPALNPNVPAIGVYVMGDYSGRLAPESIEPRWWLGGNIGGGGGPYVQVQARSAGGLIIESLAFAISEDFASSLVLYRRAARPFAAGTSRPVMAVGGRPISSTADAGIHGGALPSGDGAWQAASGPVNFAGVRWWIPPGWWFAVAHPLDPRVDFGVLARELEDAPPGVTTG